MTRRLVIVNADDFGLGPEVNEGVLRAHADGIVTSASLMVRGASAEPAVAAARGHPRLGLGLHLDLAEWECRDGEWRALYSLADLDDPAAVAAEAECQLRRFRELVGRDPGHLDSHQHVHRNEPVRGVMTAMARRLGVPLRHHGLVRYRGDFYGQGRDGVPLPGAITSESLALLLAALPEGITEVCCHPAAGAPAGSAYSSERALELVALCDPRVVMAAKDAGLHLVTFGEALAGRSQAG